MFYKGFDVSVINPKTAHNFIKFYFSTNFYIVPQELKRHTAKRLGAFCSKDAKKYTTPASNM